MDLCREVFFNKEMPAATVEGVPCRAVPCCDVQCSASCYIPHHTTPPPHPTPPPHTTPHHTTHYTAPHHTPHHTTPHHTAPHHPTPLPPTVLRCTEGGTPHTTPCSGAVCRRRPTASCPLQCGGGPAVASWPRAQWRRLGACRGSCKGSEAHAMHAPLPEQTRQMTPRRQPTPRPGAYSPSAQGRA